MVLVEQAGRYIGWTLVASVASYGMQSGKRYEGFQWKVLRAAILERDGHRCRRCGTQAKYGVTWLECDHIQRVADGGGHSPSNLRTLCKQCHDKRHRKGR